MEDKNKQVTQTVIGSPEYFKESSEVLYEYWRFKFDGGTLQEFKERMRVNYISLGAGCNHVYERVESTVPYDQCVKCYQRKPENITL